MQAQALSHKAFIQSEACFVLLPFLVPYGDPAPSGDVPGIKKASFFSNNDYSPLAADDDLVGDLDQEGGDADGVVEVGGDVEDHLDGVEEPHDGGPHLARVLQVDCMDVLLCCPKELGIVNRLGQQQKTMQSFYC